MALTTTTLTGAVAIDDNTIRVTSATGFGAGYIIQVDQEEMQITQGYVAGALTVPVLRGRDGTVTAVHRSGANVTVGVAAVDFSNPVPTTMVNFGIVRGRTLTSYSASGAIALPAPGSDAVAILNGTTAIAMTVAAPTKDSDGSILIIIGNGKSTSSVTFTGGLGLGGSANDAFTFQAAAQVGVIAIAANGAWVGLFPPVTGTSTGISVAVA